MAILTWTRCLQRLPELTVYRHASSPCRDDCSLTSYAYRPANLRAHHIAATPLTAASMTNTPYYTTSHFTFPSPSLTPLIPFSSQSPCQYSVSSRSHRPRAIGILFLQRFQRLKAQEAREHGSKRATA